MDIFPERGGRATVACMSAVLIAEPQPDIRGFLERHLADDGFDLVDAAEARPDLVLLGNASALDAFRARVGDVPVIVIGDEESDAVDRVRAFARGCDDFVARPFHYEELVARIHAVLRRVSRERGDVVHAGPIRIDRGARRVLVDGAAVPVRGKEFELLEKLACDPFRVFRKDELLRDVWGFVAMGRTRTLDSHASRLRRKLQSTGLGPFVVNVWGVGYKLLE
jgi:DNA-binding response OmpR family regulator